MRRNRPGTWPAMVIVCVFLVALLTAVQVAHVHPINSSNTNPCPLCISMHSAAPVAVTTAAVVLVRIGISTPVFKSRTISRHWHPKLFTRPPPAGC